MKNEFLQKLKIVFVVLLLGCFLYFQTFLIMEKYHECEDEGCLICEVLCEANHEEKVSLPSLAKAVIIPVVFVFLPVLYFFITYREIKKTPIKLKVRMND